MQFKKYNRYILTTLTGFKKGWLTLLKGLVVLLVIGLVSGCDDFVDVDLPKNTLTSEAVFKDAATVTAVLSSVYARMRSEGLPSSLSVQMGLYTDELDKFGIQSTFFDHSLSALNGTVSGIWSRTYNLIFEANAVIEGINNSNALSLEDQSQLRGEALFIRAYLHSLLVELFGAIPYVSTTDYVVNTNVSRMPVETVYNYIISDLVEASNLLREDISGERIRPYSAVAEALLARVYLYNENWEAAETAASNVINSFAWEPDLEEVFLKNSSGSIWQFKPGEEGLNTDDGARFILIGRPTDVALRESVWNVFESGDMRKTNWIGSVTEGTETWYYAYKYKQFGNTSSSIEYPIIFRLAEQYLIRAEARTRLGNNISGAQSDLNIIRTRAGLSNTTADNEENLLIAILNERQVELFTEQGHRWFDLKRMGKAAEVLNPIKLGWRDTDILLPIPESEILLNPNLLPQNDGY